MNFNQFLLILKARGLLVIAALIVTVTSTLVVSLLLPKSYTATTALIVDAKAKDPVSGMVLSAQMIPGYLATQSDIIKSRKVALKVIDALKMQDNPRVRADFLAKGEGELDIRHWLADLLLKQVEVQPSRESSIIELEFSGADPRFVALIANTFAQAYIDTNLEMKVEPARQTSAWYDDKLKALRSTLEQAQAKLTAYQREKGLFANDERLDVETSRLSELSSQLVMAQAQTYDSTSRQRQSSDALPEIMNSPVVQSLRAELARAEIKLSEMAEKVGKNHPQFQRAETELTGLRAKLEEELRTATRSVSSTVQVAKQREGDLRGSLSAQKARVLDLKEKREELSVLMFDVSNAQRVYDIALQRQNQTALESQSNQTDVTILNPAIPPTKASSPNVMLNVLLAVFLGSLLGIGIAFLMEMIDRRVRSSDDLAGTLELPVLGEIANLKRKRSTWFRRRSTIVRTGFLESTV